MASKKILFLVAHQDDELLTFGGPIAQSIENGYDTYVSCLSKGEGSSIRDALANKQTCDWHDGSHAHSLSEVDFVVARDREFFDSLLALGVPAKNILIPHTRFSDGKLTPWECMGAIMHYVSLHPGIEVATHSPIGSSKEHVDHQALGLAALLLQQQGSIHELSFWIDPYYYDLFSVEHPDVECKEMKAEGFRLKLSKAADSYNTWVPEESRYAIGYHSVPSYHDELRAKPTFYTHAAMPFMLAEGLEEWAKKHEKRIALAAERTNEVHRRECRELQAKNDKLNEKINKLKKSRSYRMGRALTRPVRILKKFFR